MRVRSLRFVQFRLTTLLIVVAAVSVLAAIYVRVFYPSHRVALAVGSLRAAGVDVHEGPPSFGDVFMESDGTVVKGVWTAQIESSSPGRNYDRILRDVSVLPGIVFLDVSGDFGDTQFEQMNATQNIFGLGVAGIGVTDRSIQHVATLERLRFLSILSPSLTDQNIQLLAGCSQLKLLFIASPGVTENAISDLKKKLPACHMELNNNTIELPAPGSTVRHSIELESP